MDRRWLLGGVLLAGGYGFVRAVTYRPKLDESSRILLLGDSLAQGMLPHFRGLALSADLPYVGAGLPGTRIDQWTNSQWLRQKLSTFAPTHVLISLGTNDAFTNKSPEEVAASAASLIETVKASGAHPIWIGAPALPETYGGRPFHEDILEAIRAEASYYFDSTEYVIPRGPDNLHPSAAGYAGWAGVVWNWLT